jgi:hypothetical protein
LINWSNWGEMTRPSAVFLSLLDQWRCWPGIQFTSLFHVLLQRQWLSNGCIFKAIPWLTK